MSFKITHHAADGRTRQYDADGTGGGNTPVDLEKLRSVGYGSRTRNIIREGRRADGVRIKATTDELGNTVTEHAKGDRQDVKIRPPRATMTITKEQAAWLMNSRTSTPS